MNKQTINKIENDITRLFQSGKYQPLGQDGGVLKYCLFVTDNGNVKASITLDSEIAEVKSIWCLEVDGQEVYDMTSKYYKLRK